ncbi:unnamed protein product [Macrosiphum euphorbiae]|uniref:Uncharacterized protein n=1 Tax=Macrosiphum euphorbiae TaxID=13131 RepID=A0AAV0Y4C2_9HEMI|nr:unnamed protein product [Macrosiphum euphorbiae]
MTHPWPTNPHEKQILLKRLRNKYMRLFGPCYLEEDLSEIQNPSKTNIKEVTKVQYRVQNIHISQQPKTNQQLKIEAQYERRRCAQRTQYNLEPTFTMPDTIQLVPIREVPGEQENSPVMTTPESATAIAEKTIEDQQEEPELEVILNPIEQKNIEGGESDLSPGYVMSNRARKRMLWLSKLQKKNQLNADTKG